MTDKSNKPAEAAKLRQQAEKQFAEKAGLRQPTHKPLSPEESQAALHELEVHQIELEIQNDELRRTQLELDAVRKRYFDLYDLAPVGYCTISEKGVILEANLTAASLLGVSRLEMTESPFSHFIRKEDQDSLYLHHRRLFAGDDKQDFDLRMLKTDGTVFWAHLTETQAHDAAGLPVARIALTDISEQKQAEATLRLSEQSYRDQFEANSSVMLLVDPVDGAIIEANDAAMHFYGYTREQMLAMNIGQINTLSASEIRKAMASVPHSEGAQFQFQHRLADGSLRDVEVSSSNIQFKGRDCLHSIVHDITARKRAESKLEAVEERFRQIAENSGEWVWETDSEGLYTYASPVVEQILGFEPAELVGKKHYYDLFAPEIKEELKKDALTAFSEKRSFKSFINPNLNKSGDTIFIETSGSPILDKYGNLLGYRGADKDITMRKHAEQQLADAKALTDAVVENVPLMIFLKEAKDLRFVIFNRAGEELLGYDRKYLLGKNNFDLFPTEQAVNFMANDRAVLDGEAGYLDIPEEPLLTANKGQRLLHTRKVCIRGADGVTKYLLGVSEDITERKLAENKIKVSLAEKEVILKEIHHRVKNNMQVISSLLQLQSQFVKDKDDLRMFKDSQQRIQSMSLVYNKLYESDDLAHIGFTEYVNELVTGLMRSYNCNTGGITTRIEANGVELGLDLAIPCGLIINEVISNSLQYAFPNGRPGEIRVIIQSHDGRIDMSIGDNGVGMPQEMDIKNSRTLGMTLLQTLAVHQLSGKLELKRENGTEYFISFPYKPQENRV